jgi:hypothetical protein
MKFGFSIIILGFLVLMAVLFGVGFILAQEDTTSTSVCQDSAGYKTFHGSYLSFQYPPSSTVTEHPADRSVQISTLNQVDEENYGVFIQVMGPSEYLTARRETVDKWQLEYELDESGGVSYSQYSYTTGNITLYTYLFSKNGKYYHIYGNVEDDHLMVQLMDSVE